ncbi:ZIP family metal transporter [Elusimicrobiota bacterium]
MTAFLENFHPITQALIAGCFTWFMTSAGAATVFLMREVGRKLLNGMLGFAAGIMIAASFWALLGPAIEMSEGMYEPHWFPAVTGFLLGAVCLWIIDRILPHLHIGYPIEEAEGIKTTWQKNTLFFLAMTLHNIPEGLAVGVAFGAAASGIEAATLPAAVALAIGIGIQDFPEGLAVSLPLRRGGMSRSKSFFYGQLSGFAEVLPAVIGAAAVLAVKSLLPFALSFAAGAMIFVVIEEVIPESQREEDIHYSTFGAIIGFALMMVLDVALGH